MHFLTITLVISSPFHLAKHARLHKYKANQCWHYTFAFLLLLHHGQFSNRLDYWPNTVFYRDYLLQLRSLQACKLHIKQHRKNISL